MLHQVVSSPRIIIALIVGLIFILLAISINSFYHVRSAFGPSTVTDTTGEAVVGTSTPNRQGRIQPTGDFSVVSASRGPREDYQMPDSLTGRFGISLFRNVMIGNNTDQPIQDLRFLTENMAREVMQEIDTTHYTNTDLTVVANTPGAIRTWANQAALAINNTYISGMENERVLLDQAVRLNRQQAFTDLATRASMYETIVSDLLATPVPAAMADAHRYLVNSFQAMHLTTRDFSQAKADPIRAYARLARYDTDFRNRELAMANVAVVIIRSGESFQTGDPGLFFGTFLPEINI